MSLEYLTQSPALLAETAFERRKKGKTTEFTGLTKGAKALEAAALCLNTGGHVLLAAASEEEAETLYSELPYYGVDTESLFYYPMSLNHNYGDTGPDITAIGERLAALYALSANEKRVVVVAPAAALLQRTMPRDALLDSAASLAVGEERDIEKVTGDLVAAGYARSEICDHHGVFCKRGDLLDVFPSGSEYPARIYFDWDRIKFIRYFDPETQRSVKEIGGITLLPVREILASHVTREAVENIREDAERKARSLGNTGVKILNTVSADLERLEAGEYFDRLEYYIPYIYPRTLLMDYLSGYWLGIVSEPSSVDTAIDGRLAKIQGKLQAAEQNGLFVSDRLFYLADSDTVLRRLAANTDFRLTETEKPCRWMKPADYTVRPGAEENEAYTGRMGALMRDISLRSAKGCKVVLATTRESRMRKVLMDYELRENENLRVRRAILDRGFRIKNAVWVITDNDMFGTKRVQKVRRLARDSRAIASHNDLHEGDIVVHTEKGICRYAGVSYRTALGMTVETIELEFAGGARLFVPTDRVGLIRRFTGSDGVPVLSKLGGGDWEKKKRKARKKAAEVAGDLVELYAYRETLPGYAYGRDDRQMAELEESFPYRETASQYQAILDVKADLESRKPMDRLICGDVGFGKTEVAIRAAFKVVSGGRQAVLLAPTTVLAKQHFASFSERLALFPVKVALLSRFQTRQEIKEALAGIKDGSINIAIGTHRLLSKDVEFKDLGLLIIDEEQRFGVRHKEKLRQLRRNIDTLALSATPIPRTLHMAMSGIRGLSNIVDAPEGRMPIKTVVREYDEEMAADAIRRELERNGQVFFIHNRVEDIEEVAERLEELVPECALDIAHGQMNEKDLEEVMVDFYEGRLDVLVATTIIENGLDVPNANTIIVDCSERLGLAQLYQLRGRVGRSNRQAYAYLFFRKDAGIPEAAIKRLGSLREFTELGSGFRIAQRDLEIRGAGSVLGESQHGCIEEVGFDLYCQMVSEEIDRLRGKNNDAPELPPAGLSVNAYIPKSYIEADGPRLLIYNRLASCASEEVCRDIRSELEDRFGSLPPETDNLLRILMLRIKARENGVEKISSANGEYQVFLKGLRLSPGVREEYAKKYPRIKFGADRISFSAGQFECIEKAEEIVALVPELAKREAGGA